MAGIQHKHYVLEASLWEACDVVFSLLLTLTWILALGGTYQVSPLLSYSFGSKSFVGRSLHTGNNSSHIKLEPLLLASVDNPCLSKLLL